MPSAIRIHHLKYTMVIGILLVIDLDRTLFDTTKFLEDCLEWVRQDPGLGPQVELAARVAERHGDFDLFDFLEQHYGYRKEVVRDAVIAHIRRKYGRRQNVYLLRGAARLIRDLRGHPQAFPVIFTTGTVFNQELKLFLCPLLRGMPYEILDGNKGERVRDNLDQYGSVLFQGLLYPNFALVDDKGGNLRPVKARAIQAKKPLQLLFHVIRADGKDSADTGRVDIENVYDLFDVLRQIKTKLQEL